MKGGFNAALLAAAGGVVLAVGLSAAPSWRTAMIAAYVLLLGAIGVELLARLLGTFLPGGGPSALEAALRRPAPARPVPERLQALMRLLTLAGASARHAHAHLYPTLRTLAADRLAWSHGTDLTHPDARRILGEPAWTLLAAEPPAERAGERRDAVHVRSVEPAERASGPRDADPVRPAEPPDRAQRGPDADTIAAALTAIERAGEP